MGGRKDTAKIAGGHKSARMGGIRENARSAAGRSSVSTDGVSNFAKNAVVREFALMDELSTPARIVKDVEFESMGGKRHVRCLCVVCRFSFLQ